MNRLKSAEMRKKVTLSVDSSVYKQFQDYCEENAIMVSKKIEIFMKNYLEHMEKQDR